MKKRSRKKLVKPAMPGIRLVSEAGYGSEFREAPRPFKWSWLLGTCLVIGLLVGAAPKVLATNEIRMASEIVELKNALKLVCKQRDDAKATLQACMQKSAHGTVVRARKHSALTQVQKVPCP